MLSTSRFLAAFLALGSLQAAQAEDIKVYPGRVCTGIESPAPAFLRYDFYGRAINTDVYPLLVGCPVVRDVWEHEIDLDDSKICVVDNHPYENVICLLFSQYQDGEEVFETYGYFESEGSSNEVQCLEALNGEDVLYTEEGDTSVSPAHYWVACQLPGKYQENNGVVCPPGVSASTSECVPNGSDGKSKVVTIRIDEET